MAESEDGFVTRRKIIVALVIAAVAGGISGAIFAYSPDLPAISTLDDYAPSTITRVFAAGG